MKDKSCESYALPPAQTPRRRARPSPLKLSTLFLVAALCFAAPAARGQTKPNIAGDVEGGKKK